MTSVEDDDAALVRALRVIATQGLEAHGRFMPVAAVLGDQGGVQGVAVPEGSSREVEATLVALLAGGARTGQFRAVGLATDVNLNGADGEVLEAIAIATEHRAGAATTRYFPYTRADGGVQVQEEPWEQAGAPRFFGRGL